MEMAELPLRAHCRHIHMATHTANMLGATAFLFHLLQCMCATQPTV